MTPAITVPLDDAGRPAIRTTEYRAPLPPPTPPSPPEPIKPKVIYAPQPDAGGARSLPLPVRERLSGVCAGKCRNLAVDLQTPTRLNISFLVRDQVEAEMLTNMLGALPELAPYKVDFEVQIGQ